MRREVDDSKAVISMQLDFVSWWNDSRLIAEDPACSGEIDRDMWSKLYRPNTYIFNTEYTTITDTVLGKSGTRFESRIRNIRVLSRNINFRVIDYGRRRPGVVARDEGGHPVPV